MDEPEVSVFCGNFGKDNVTEGRLEELFEDKNLKIKRIDMKRGFAFVYIIGEQGEVQDAINSMHGSTSIEGGTNILRIEVAQGGKNQKQKEIKVRRGVGDKGGGHGWRRGKKGGEVLLFIC